MKAVIWTKYGTPDVLTIGEVKKPIPKDDEILIKVKATTVSFGDCEMRALKLAFVFKLMIRLMQGIRKPRKGTTLGQEFSGVVEQTGAKVTRFKKGDRVFGQTDVKMGAYAQFMTIKGTATIAEIPKNVSFEQAVCLPLGGLEARYYIRKANLKAGSSVLVIGAGGSIGTMGIQLLKLNGAKVTAVDTGEKFDVMKQAGADKLIDYTKQDYFDGRQAYDGILDVVGKTSLKKGIALLKDGGVYMHANPKVSHMLFRRDLSGTGEKKIIIKKYEESQADLKYLSDLLKEGTIAPIIDRTMTLEEIVQAHYYVEAGKKKGNLVIKVAHD